MLNDPSYVEAARVFAENTLAQPDLTERQRIEQILSHALTRSPSEEEITILQSLRQEQQAYYNQHPDEAIELVNIGDRPTKGGIETTTLASYVAVTRAVFNMHEFITRN